jgi:hypothetical protein
MDRGYCMRSGERKNFSKILSKALYCSLVLHASLVYELA